MTADVRRTPRRGTSSRMCTERMHPTQARKIVACARQTRPSLGPSTRARRSSLCTKRQNASWWGVRFGITVEQAHASGKNQHWGHSTGRSTARRVSPLPQGRRRGTFEKEGGRGLRPCEDQEPRLGCSHVVFQLQKSVGDVWPRISSANALQKERQGRVNGGLARSEGRRVKPSAAVSSEGYSRESASPPRRERTGARPRVVRERHPAVTTSPKAVR